MFITTLFLSEDPTNTELMFLTCAMVGTLFFVLKVVMALAFGVGDEFDFDGGVDIDVDADFDANIEHGGTSTFKLVSITSVLAFLAMFGWAGMSAHVQLKYGAGLSTLIAFVVGFATMWCVAMIFSLLKKLTSDGAAFSMNQVLGCRAEVYQRIPANGQGRVHVTINGVLRELDAETKNDDDIDSFQVVKITDVKGESLVVVERIS